MAYEVRNPEVEEILRKFGRMMKDTMPSGFGFALLIFTYGQGGSMFYISSAERQDMINSMREFIQKHEAN